VFVTARGSRPEYRIFLRGTAPGASMVPLRLRRDEQVPTARF
jgi:hypothetical protein